MSFLSRLFKSRRDPREQVRPLWHRTVELARDTGWYADLGVADSVPGRFDMVTVTLALVMLRMEQDQDLLPHSALLAELFVEDMDGQLRESGVGDVVVGKHIGRLMSVLGGRLGTLREALAQDGDAALAEAVKRNVTMADETQAPKLAARLRQFARQLAASENSAVLKGEISL